MNICTDRCRWLLVLAAVSAVMLVLFGCGDSGSKAAANAKSTDTAELFTIPQEQMTHVQVLTVQSTTLARTLRLTGAVAYNSFRTTPVISQVGGPVSRMVVVPGQKVQRGVPMLYVSSPDYSQLRTNYLKAKSAYELAQRANARARDLYEHKAIAEQNLEQAESAEVQAGGDLAAAQAALKVMGITDPDRERAAFF
jgi:cobalt-zinc-cadmium efflux system membrane fusion protein